MYSRPWCWLRVSEYYKYTVTIFRVWYLLSIFKLVIRGYLINRTVKLSKCLRHYVRFLYSISIRSWSPRESETSVEKSKEEDLGNKAKQRLLWLWYIHFKTKQERKEKDRKETCMYMKKTLSHPQTFLLVDASPNLEFPIPDYSKVKFYGEAVLWLLSWTRT